MRAARPRRDRGTAASLAAQTSAAPADRFIGRPTRGTCRLPPAGAACRRAPPRAAVTRRDGASPRDHPRQRAPSRRPQYRLHPPSAAAAPRRRFRSRGASHARGRPARVAARVDTQALRALPREQPGLGVGAAQLGRPHGVLSLEVDVHVEATSTVAALLLHDTKACAGEGVIRPRARGTEAVSAYDACDDSIHRCAVKCEMGALDSSGASASTVASVAYEMVRVDTLASSPPGSGSYPPSSNSS